MTVWMDVHEKGGMRALVESACDDVSMTDDFGGDYAVGGYLIERKRWAEVAQRMTETDRNLFYQVEKLVEAADELDLEPALMLEGEIGSPLKHSKISEDRIAKYLSGLPVMGVTVIASTGRTCSAVILSRLEDGSPPDVRRIRGTASSDEHAQRFIVEGFPGVGPGKAEALLERFGTVSAVMSAEADELADVDGIGPATVDKIHDVLHREF